MVAGLAIFKEVADDCDATVEDVVSGEGNCTAAARDCEVAFVAVTPEGKTTAEAMD